jgi:predicted transcriptional regulator
MMGVSEILDEIKSLPAEQRWQILERTREMLGSEIPESFKEGMAEIARGEVIELNEALQELDRPEWITVSGRQSHSVAH